MYLQSSQDQRQLGWNSSQNYSLFSNLSLQNRAARISPRLHNIYDQISQLFSANFLETNKLDFEAKITKILSSLTYKPSSKDGPICNQQVKPRGFFCFDCNLAVKLSSISCEECFDYAIHKDHYFSVIENINGLCDCGNDKCIKSESFCQKHKVFKPQMLPFNRQAQQYLKQFEFLFYFLFRIKRQISQEDNKHEIMWQTILKIMHETIKESYVYQLKTSQLMIKPFSEEYKYQQRPVIEIMFTQKWSLKTLQIIVQIFLSMYPVKIARKKILLQIIKIFNTPFESCDTLRVISKLFFQYGQMQNIILKLFKKNIVKPIACYQLRQQFNDAFDFHTFIFQWYDSLERNHLYPEIMQTILTNIPIKCFFNLPLQNFQDNEATQKNKKIFECLYTRMIIEFIKGISKTPTNRNILKKMIRQCYSISIQQEENTFLSAQRTLGVCIFAYFDYDVKNYSSLTFEGFYQLLAPSQPIEKLRTENFLNKILKILSNFQKQVINEQYLLLSDKIFISINYSFMQFLTLYFYSIDHTVNKNLIHVTFQQGRFRVDRVDVFQDMSCFEVLIDAQIQQCKPLVDKCNGYLNGQINNPFLGQIEFIGNLQKIYGSGIKINLLICCFLGAFQGETNEVILANLLKNPNKDKIHQFYSQLALLHQQESVGEFKVTAQKWIDNEQILQPFLRTQYEQIKQKDINSNDIEYHSNISFYSEFAGNTFEQENALRLKLKILSNPQRFKKWNQIISYFFSDKICDKLLNFFAPIVKILCSEKVSNSIPGRQYLRISVSLLLDLYIQTRFAKLKEFVYEIRGKIASDNQFDERLSRIISILEEQGSHNKQKDPVKTHQQSQQFKKHAKQKKLKLMKDMKQKQAKILAQKNDQPPENETGENKCIICRQSSTKEPLYFLSKVKFSNALNFTLLKNKEPILIFSTCGHQIHQSCLSQNLEENNQYASKYPCFLCQQSSNLRIPVSSDLDAKACRKFYQDFLTISKIQLEGNQLIQQYPPVDPQITITIIRSLATMTYLYSTCCEKIFHSRMKPLLDRLLAIIKIILKADSNKQCQMKKISNNKELNSVICLFEQVINDNRKQKVSPAQIILHQMKEKNLTNNLNSIIAQYKQNPFSKQNNLIINLFQLPKELYQLTLKARKCESCHKIYSNMSACLFCGLKLCQNCKQTAEKHRVECHLGTIVTINLSSGNIIYENPKGALIQSNLYKNYASQVYSPANFQKPKQNSYFLDTKAYDKILEDIFLENVNDVIDTKIRSRGQINCQVQ